MESFYDAIKYILHVEETRVNDRKKESVLFHKSTDSYLIGTL